MEMKNPEKFRKNIDGVWYYKCNCCKQWKIETEFGCDNYCNARHGHTTRCKRCLHIINHYDKGYTKDNTQLVCDIVNRMKLDLPMNEFVTLCKIIYDEQNRT